MMLKGLRIALLSIITLIVTLISGVSVMAQNTIVTGTITDPNSTAYAFGTYTIALSNPTSFQPLLGGLPVPNSQLSYSGQLDTTGSFSISLPRNTGSGAITVGGATTTQWIFTFCVNPSQIRTYPAPVANICFNSTQTIGAASPQALGTISGGTVIPTGTGSGAWNGLTSGTNTNTGFFKSIQPGDFTAGAHREFHQRILDGGNATGDTCPGNYSIGGATAVTDAFSACNYGPASGVTNSFSNAIAGYAQPNDPNQGGQFGRVIGVGGYFVCTTGANNTKCIGAAPQVEGKVGQTNIFLESMELGVSAANTTDQGVGLLLSVEGTGAQPTGNNMPAIQIQTPSGAGTFTAGLDCQDGSVSSGNGRVCLAVGKATPSSQSNSQNITLAGNDGSAGTTGALGLTSVGYLNLSSTTGYTVQGGAGGSFNGGGPAIWIKSTAGLSVNQLVKLDTGNADSVVVCTTADTTACMGFVIDPKGSGANGLCTAGSNFCGVVVATGTKVQGILGTGTCAIGNYVVVDTTTNGRVKCQAGIPAQGAMIGMAMAAQVTVGNNVDVVSKFQ